MTLSEQIRAQREQKCAFDARLFKELLSVAFDKINIDYVDIVLRKSDRICTMNIEGGKAATIYASPAFRNDIKALLTTEGFNVFIHEKFPDDFLCCTPFEGIERKEYQPLIINI